MNNDKTLAWLLHSQKHFKVLTALNEKRQIHLLTGSSFFHICTQKNPVHGHTIFRIVENFRFSFVWMFFVSVVQYFSIAITHKNRITLVSTGFFLSVSIHSLQHFCGIQRSIMLGRANRNCWTENFTIRLSHWVVPDKCTPTMNVFYAQIGCT